MGESSKLSKNPVDPAEDLDEDDRTECLPPTTGSKNLFDAALVTSTSSSSFESSRKDRVLSGQKCASAKEEDAIVKDLKFKVKSSLAFCRSSPPARRRSRFSNPLLAFVKDLSWGDDGSKSSDFRISSILLCKKLSLKGKTLLECKLQH